MVGRPHMRFRNLIAGALVCASMLIAAPAYAQTASEAYSKPAGSVQERISTERRDPPDETTTERQTASNRGDLPFTGLDVALIMAAGGVLLAMGFGMRRLSRSEVV